jgi:hypothetical protein
MIHEKALTHTLDATKEPPPDFSGRWVNQLSSTMQLTVAGIRVSGIYESAVSGGGGSIRGDLVGFVNGDLIAFVVTWPTAASRPGWDSMSLITAQRRSPRCGR